MDGGCRKKPILSVGGSLNFGLNANAFGRCVVRCLPFNGDNNASAMIGDGLTDAFYSDLLALEAERCAKNERQKRAGGEEYTYVTSADNQGRQSGAGSVRKDFRSRSNQ